MKPKDIVKTVDHLGTLCAQIANLEAEATKLKDRLKGLGDGSYEGNLFRATVSTYIENRLDTKAIREEMGEAWALARSKSNPVTKLSVKVKIDGQVSNPKPLATVPAVQLTKKINKKKAA